MFRNLAFSITFPPNEINPLGRSFNHMIDFDRGLSAITGSNEMGKSLILEIATFCLFGSKALRGMADDYKSLKATLVFEVRGTSYQVVRKGTTSAELYLVGEADAIAVGTKPVNAKIVDIFGYGYEVFCVANAVLQGEVERLGSMLPSERKRLVDTTVGLNVIDALIDWTNLQASNVQKEADAIGGVTVAPTEPAKPEGYQHSETLKVERDRLRRLVDERNGLLGFLCGPEQSEPVKPECKIANSAADLKLLVDGRAAAVARRNRLEGELNAIPTAELDAQQLDCYEGAWADYDLWQERVKFEKNYLKPALSRIEIAEARNLLDIAQKQKVLQDDFAALARAKADATSVCPKCEHEWVDDQRLTEREAALAERAQHLPKEDVVPTHTKEELDVAERALLSWEAMAPTWERLKDAKEVAKPSMSKDEIAQQRQAIKLQARRAELIAEIDTISIPDDVSEMWKERVQYEADMAAYERVLDRYNEWKAEVQIKRARLGEIDADVEAKWTGVVDAMAQAVAYENAFSTFALAKEKYDATMAVITEKLEEADQFKKAVIALRDLKRRIKQHLLPSLNKVASHLLAKMTGGQRRRIEIDDDFNIKVDGQRLDTLSGSGKAVANLSVRIGLGQVLTAKTFSVLIGDEIDAAMDADRAGNTSECLRGLTNSYNQIILVSHKSLDADHYIELR